MFDDFDYKKALGGGGKLVKGVVKAVSPDAGPGVDEAHHPARLRGEDRG